MNNEKMLPFRCHKWHQTLENPVIPGFSGTLKLFPLNRASGLRGQVEQAAVDALYLSSDPGGDMLEQFEGHIFHGGGHGVHGIDRADDHAPLVHTLIVTDADRLDVRDGGKVLPHLALQAVLGKFLTKDGVGLPDGLQAVAGDGAQATHTQAGAGEGLAVDHGCGVEPLKMLFPGPCRRRGPRP